eukprot:TRINITY_DN3350_c0_g1_i9.p1 TRINITY_DN3350_c0_g1~~TRINITY_DN3350_c0_g1_i9.p1  ORF type:complete len:225 (+),score=-12.30 TRINITY_DN3350_c0_g1_i9:66-740(+)
MIKLFNQCQQYSIYVYALHLYTTTIFATPFSYKFYSIFPYYPFSKRKEKKVNVHVQNDFFNQENSRLKVIIRGTISAGFEQQNSDLAQVEVDEVFSFVGDVGAEISSHNTMPSRVVLLVKLLFNVGCYVLFNVVLLQCLGGTIHCVVLHVLRHIRVLDNCLTFTHYYKYLFSYVPVRIWRLLTKVKEWADEKGTTVLLLVRCYQVTLFLRSWLNQMGTFRGVSK